MPTPTPVESPAHGQPAGRRSPAPGATSETSIATTIAGTSTRATASPHAPPLVGGGHVPVLDAFRGLAILIVLVHNASYIESGPHDTIPFKLWEVTTGAGWFGVQLFFVLSGLLITGILLDTRGREGWLRTFYLRRFLRIFPLYYAALLAYWVLVPRMLGVPRLAEAQGVPAWHYWLYVSNWPVYPDGDPTSLTHFWSLAVEEQFYLVWPLVVLALSRRGLAVLAGALCIVAPAFRLWLHSGAFPTDVTNAMGYEWTIARMDALAFGALCAVALREIAWRSPAARERLGRASRWTAYVATGIVAAMVVVRGGLHKVGPAVQVYGQTLVAVAAAGMLLGFTTTPTAGSARWWAARALDRAWLRWLGKYSYGIYVVHVPLHRVGMYLVGTRLTTGPASTRLLLSIAYAACILAASCLAALVTWHVIESPFLRLKRFVPSGGVRRTVGPTAFQEH